MLILLPAPPASAQSRDDFAYWDANGNGNLTCPEALGRDEGLRLPAYRDNTNDTAVIYEWLSRVSGDRDNDGIDCESNNNPNGYIPSAQVEPPVEPQACSADAETWRGLQVCDEQPRDGYDRAAFGSGHRSLEDEIIAALPPTMKANGQVYTPYSCLAFDIMADGTAETDIEHIVALAETLDSGIADDRRRDIARDLDNLTIADPTVNGSKSAQDAAEWMPTRHGAWFAERVTGGFGFPGGAFSCAESPGAFFVPRPGRHPERTARRAVEESIAQNRQMIEQSVVFFTAARAIAKAALEEFERGVQ